MKEQTALQQNGHQPTRQAINRAKLEALATELLLLLGEDPTREGLIDTPRRWAAAWLEFFNYEPGPTDTTFSVTSTSQLVCVSDMTIWSMCEHHLMPFACNVAIGYVPDEHVLGLSKFARIAHGCAHKLQLQERLADCIAQEIQRAAQTQHVAVFIQGVHSCMAARGIRTPAKMTTISMHGRFQTDMTLRDDFWHMIGKQPQAE